jgi:DNA-binding CsgD family transcriptional regulator
VVERPTVGDTGGVTGTIDSGREAWARRSWAAAVAGLRAADRDAPLVPDDLERLGIALFLTGAEDEAAEAWARAYHVCLGEDDVARAARCAFWIGFSLDITGTDAPAAGWYERARRLVVDAGLDCVEQGYVRVPAALAALMVQHDAEAAHDAFVQIVAIAEEFRDPDLATLGRLGLGHALVMLGRRAAGVAMLDEVMVAVTRGEVSPALAGLAYCAVIEICQETYDLRRARAWTDALAAWCDSQPDLVPYKGQCLVHRAEVLALDGAWDEAMAAVRNAVEQLSQPPGHMGVGAACYQRGQLHRLRGEHAAAEDAYRQASHWGHAPQPGLALLRLAQGRRPAAAAALARALPEAVGPLARSRLLPAGVEVALALGDVVGARAAADELAAVATEVDAAWLRAAAAHALGAVAIAEGDHVAALPHLHAAQEVWREAGAPYESARTRELVAVACRALGDDDGAALELGAAVAAFEQLGAVPDAERARALDAGAVDAGAVDAATEVLSPRERQVLALVATGRTNRAVAAELHISEKTVARHLSNIFAKLGLSSRSAATAYAYEHGVMS